LKPMGTITKYFPFIDEETKSILNSLMDESDNYYEFVQRLCETAIENEVPINLAYLAAVQAWWCRMSGTLQLIGERYNDIPWIKPWLHIVDSGERDQVLAHDIVIKYIDSTLEHPVDDWIEIDLHILHAFFHHPFGEVISLLEPIEKVKGLINENQHLDCYESITYAFEAIAKWREGEMMEALEGLQKGKTLAKSHDDELYLYMNMLQEGDLLKNVNVKEASVVFEDLYELVENLQVPAFFTEILNDASLLYETMGEFDLAISCHEEMMKILDVGDRRISDTTFIILGRTYATLGDGEKSLEWINRGIEQNAPFESAMMLLYKAWALALVDRVDDAEQTLERGYELVIKTGLERLLGSYYHISGVVESRKGDLLAGLDFLEKAFTIANLRAIRHQKNRILLDLARTENLIATQSKEGAKIAAPGKWLSTLEDYACSCNLPGIRMYAALLKSDFYQNNGQLKDALATLQDALTITDSLGVQTLRRKINSRISEVAQLIREEVRAS
jgi:tetratricopeptide (TPR) repeat protein